MVSLGALAGFMAWRQLRVKFPTLPLPHSEQYLVGFLLDAALDLRFLPETAVDSVFFCFLRGDSSIW